MNHQEVENELRFLMQWRNNGISFIPGSPGVEMLNACSKMLLNASDKILNDPNINIGNLFKYGENQGDQEFRENLAHFLTDEYGDDVKSSNLMVTAGATQGLHAILTILCDKKTPVFIEDPTYFLASRMIKDDLQINTIPVQGDETGMIPECLEKALVSYKDQKQNVTCEPSSRFWAAVYLVPVFSNPTGWTYTEERCKKLVLVARKYNILLIAEDVYNLIYFQDACPPKRLLSYDLATDPDYTGGNVLSNGTFSKIFAPSIRLGWIEGPAKLLCPIYESFLTWSGGSFNHYMAKVMSHLLSSGALTEHTEWLRVSYKKRLAALCDTLDEYKPTDWQYHRPKGGFFVWVTFPEHISALEFLRFARERYDVTFLPGICCSPTLGSKNSARLAFSSLNEDAIVSGLKKLILAYEKFTKSKKNELA
ncbi:2-aminoadipate transaminase [Biomphalaria pfeifferi]|uniref:2-aminoadipate transaminase n=1 Tax=Biomphalaria pfeifferi TaxID=112525 RepID=A0AAD8AVB2_BIOPF|nr:2-aminoadipate transaminase [Biomphalaria pfeifferi]